MLTRYISEPNVPGVCLHNTRNWQVTELMGGLACEILQKSRKLDEAERRRGKLTLHDCYDSLFMQGDEACAFLEELRRTQAKHRPSAVDKLLLEAYEHALH